MAGGNYRASEGRAFAPHSPARAPYLPRGNRDSFVGPLAASVTGHILLAAFFIFEILPSMGPITEPEVYSVTLEASQFLGGISQVPKDSKKTDMAPVKKLAAQTEPEDIPKVEQKNVKPEEPAEAEDAEVSLSETKPTPVPPKPTPEVKKATPVPAKPTAKPTSVPTKAPQKQKSDGEETNKQYQAALQRYLGESTDAGGKNFGGAKAGVGKGGGGGIVRPPEFFVYEKMLRARIKDAWRWYDANAALITQIEFYIEPDGRVRNVSVSKSSGDSSFDESVVRAVMKTSPLPPPPPTVYQFFKHVRTTFDPRD